MINNKKGIYKAGAVGLSLVLAAGVTGGTVYAGNSVREKENTEVKEQIEDAVESIWVPLDQDKMGTDETVYVLLDADGKTKKVIVSDWKESSQRMMDNTKNAEMPIEIQVSYFLDGKSVTAEELLGQNGHVTISYTYKNQLSEIHRINGREEEIYVPFAVLTGLVLDNEHFQNVSVSQGKVLHDGDRSIVTGITFPGLAENLDMESFTDSMTIEADVTDFSMGNTYCIAVNSVFEHLNLENIEDTEDLQAALDELSSASQQLVGGSSDLYDGISTLYDRSGDLSDGAQKLAAGAASLQTGSEKLLKGAEDLRNGAGQVADGTAALKSGTTNLQSGAEKLEEGLKGLASQNENLTAAAAQVFDTLLAAANTQLNENTQLQSMGISANMTRDNYAEFLNGLLQRFGDENIRAQVEAAVKSNEAQIRTGVKETVTVQVRGQVIAGMQSAGYPISEELYQTVKNGGTVSGNDAGVSEQLRQLVEEVDREVAAQMASDAITQLIEQAVVKQEQELIEANMEAVVNAANTGAAQIKSLKASLDSYNAFYQGLLQYTAGVSSAKDGAVQLSGGAAQVAAGAAGLADGTGGLVGGCDTLLSGSRELSEGIKELKNGADTLSGGSAALIEGILQLKDGSGKLYDGMTEFDGEGISKLTEVDTEGIGELIDRLKATTEAAGSYHSFTGKEEQTGSVKFIYKLAEIQ